jgi:hypothetical protein
MPVSSFHLQTVAATLRDEGGRRPDPSEVDAYYRSAFNRLYYAAYWEVRVRVGSLLPDDAVRKHKAMPDALDKFLRAEVRRLSNSLKRGLIKDFDYEASKKSVRRFGSLITSALRSGFAVRCRADYDFDIVAANVEGSVQLGRASLREMERRLEELRKAVDGLCLLLRQAGRL